MMIIICVFGATFGACLFGFGLGVWFAGRD